MKMLMLMVSPQSPTFDNGRSCRPDSQSQCPSPVTLLVEESFRFILGRSVTLRGLLQFLPPCRCKWSLKSVSTGSELCPRAEQCKANLGLMSGGQRRADTSISKVTPRSVRRLAVGLLGILKIIQSRNCDQASCTQYALYLLDGTKVEGGVELQLLQIAQIMKLDADYVDSS